MKKPVSMIDYYSDQKSNKRKQTKESQSLEPSKSMKRGYGTPGRAGQKVRENTLKTLLNEEADAICNAGRYQ